MVAGVEALEDAGYEVVEGTITRTDLYYADELFFTGTAAEVTPIRSVDKYKVGSGRRGPITHELQEAFFDIVQRGNDPYGWLTPIPSLSTDGISVASSVEETV